MKFVVRMLFLMIFLNQNAAAINLYQETLYKPLASDYKAYMPGDVLTVHITETSRAQSEADLFSGKAIKAAIEAGYSQQNIKTHLGVSGQGKSAAKTGRNGRIKASITVRIIDILPGLTYRVSGLQKIRINGEEQTIKVSGIVRPEDISAQNTILSTRLADAKIIYGGNGDISNVRDRNYLYHILSFVGLV